MNDNKQVYQRIGDVILRDRGDMNMPLNDLWRVIGFGCCNDAGDTGCNEIICYGLRMIFMNHWE